MNAFNQEQWYSLATELEAARADDSVRCVVLTGTGPAFSAGQDLGEMADPSVFADQEPGFQRLMPVVESFDKVLIAAVNGVGVGIGATVLLHCDVVLMADDARLKLPFISLGVTAEASSSVLLPAAAGYQRAAEILFTEPWIDAAQAVADGFALRAVPAAELMDQTMELARGIGGLPLAPLQATKRLLPGRQGTGDRSRPPAGAGGIRSVGAVDDRPLSAARYSPNPMGGSPVDCSPKSSSAVASSASSVHAAPSLSTRPTRCHPLMR